MQTTFVGSQVRGERFILPHPTLRVRRRNSPEQIHLANFHQIFNNIRRLRLTLS